MRGVRALLLPLLFAPVAVYAEGDPEKFRVGGALRTAAVYDDNFRNNDRELDDLGYWIEPRLDAEYTRRKLRLKAELGADLRIHPQRSRDNDTFLHAVGEFDWRLGRGLTLFVSDAFVPGSFKLGQPSDDVGNLGQTNRADAELRYERDLPRQRGVLFGIGGSRFTAEDFTVRLDGKGDGLTEQNRGFQADFWEADAYLELQQRFGRKHRVYVRGEARERRFDEFRQADYSELFGLIGVRGQLGRRIRWGAALGYGQLDYDRGGSDGRILGNAKIEYPFGRGYQLDASVSRRLTSDAAFSDFRETTWRAALGKRMGSRMEVTLASFLTSFRNSAADERDNRVWGAELEVRRHLWRRVEGSLRIQHFHNGGDESVDDFRKNRVLLELSYRF